MSFLEEDEEEIYRNPIDVIEQIAENNNWGLERLGIHEILLEIEGDKDLLYVHSLWKEDVGSLHLTTNGTAVIPKKKVGALKEVLSSINSRLWLGHFDFCPRLKRPLFRYGTLLEVNEEGVSELFLQKILLISLTKFEKFSPIFHLVLGEKKGPYGTAFLDLALADPLGTA